MGRSDQVQPGQAALHHRPAQQRGHSHRPPQPGGEDRAGPEDPRAEGEFDPDPAGLRAAGVAAGGLQEDPRV